MSTDLIKKILDNALDSIEEAERDPKYNDSPSQKNIIAAIAFALTIPKKYPDPDWANFTDSGELYFEWVIGDNHARLVICPSGEEKSFFTYVQKDQTPDEWAAGDIEDNECAGEVLEYLDKLL